MQIEEVNELLSNIYEDTLYIPTLLAVMLGLRRGEVLGLKWSDVDLKKGTAKIHNTITRVSKVVEKSTKTENSNRTISLGNFVSSALKKELNRQKENRLKFGDKYCINDFVCKHDDGIPFEPSTFSQTFSQKVKKLNITQVTFHELRHANASLILSPGIAPKIASERLRHSTIKLTMDLYSHVLKNANEEEN